MLRNRDFFFSVILKQFGSLKSWFPYIWSLNTKTHNAENYGTMIDNDIFFYNKKNSFKSFIKNIKNDLTVFSDVLIKFVDVAQIFFSCSLFRD